MGKAESFRKPEETRAEIQGCQPGTLFVNILDSGAGHLREKEK